MFSMQVLLNLSPVVSPFLNNLSKIPISNFTAFILTDLLEISSRVDVLRQIHPAYPSQLPSTFVENQF